MSHWLKLVFEVGGKLVGGLAESIGLSIGKKVFPPHGGSNNDSALATAISNDSSIVKAIIAVLR